jgi:hypothetical protein
MFTVRYDNGDGFGTAHEYRTLRTAWENATTFAQIPDATASLGLPDGRRLIVSNWNDGTLRVTTVADGRARSRIALANPSWITD